MQSLLEPWLYLCQYPGKDVRGKLIEAFNKWIKLPEDKLKIITKIVGDLHSASLL